MADAGRGKINRSRSGCQTCRARKVRCDEKPGQCGNCERLGLVCAPPSRGNSGNSTGVLSSPQGDTPHGMLGSGLKRKRTYRSCTDCRASKSRCSGHKPKCARCLEKSLDCIYEDTSEPIWKQKVSMTSQLQSPSGELDLADGDMTIESGTVLRGGSEESTSSASMGLPSAEHQTRSQTDDPPHDLAWLAGARLPDHSRTRVLVAKYFAHVHPLRCFAFLHKPSFLQELDDESNNSRDENPLLHIVCALGALFYVAEYELEMHARLPFNSLMAGNEWAKRAQSLILAKLDRISVENLMAAVLLHDYEIRMGSYANAFMLSGITARMAQALQINLEHSTDVLCRDVTGGGPSASVKESRRRLMWACYVTDSLVGNGVDQLTLIDESDIKIQLPCNEQSFTLENPCITELLDPGQILKFLPPERIPTNPADNMGMTAFYLRHTAIRRKVLKYIKNLNTAIPPWMPNSEFRRLEQECRNWYEHLPANLQFTPNTLYIRQETSQVGALLALHHIYHHTACDLYRVGTPELYKLRSAFSYPPEQTDFLRHLQTALFEHAKSLATVMAVALRHGPHAIADSLLPTTTYDSCRIMLYYLTQIIDPATESSKALMAEALPHIRNNVKALKMMRSIHAQAGPLFKAAEAMLHKAGLDTNGQSIRHNIIPDDPYATTEADELVLSTPGTPAQSAPDYVLNPLSIYRLARKSIPEKHAPERQLPSMPTAVIQHSDSQHALPHQHPPSIMSYGSYETPMGSDLPHDFNAAEQINFDELQSLFASDPTGWTWQPSETAVSSRIEANSLPPWESASINGQLDAWLPTFSLEP